LPAAFLPLTRKPAVAVARPWRGAAVEAIWAALWRPHGWLRRRSHPGGSAAACTVASVDGRIGGFGGATHVASPPSRPYGLHRAPSMAAATATAGLRVSGKKAAGKHCGLPKSSSLVLS